MNRAMARACAGAISAWLALGGGADGQGAGARPRGDKPDAGIKTPKATVEAFHPVKSTWAKFTERKIDPARVEPSEAELATRFSLEKLGPRASDGIVEYRHPKLGMKFVFVPAGVFPMGSNHGEIFANRMVIDSAIRGKADDSYFGNEQPQNQVYVSPYFIGVHEVTNAEYRVFLDAWQAGNVSPECEWPLLFGKLDHKPYLTGDPRRVAYDGDRQPIVGITWFDAYAFCRWMGGRLPTEAEWEKAARGTDHRIFPWGNRYDPMRANFCESHNYLPLAVGTYPGGRSPYGCFDMAGNAAEYCLDAFEESVPRNLPLSNPCLVERYPGRDRRSQRGGSFNRFGFLFKGRTTARGFSKILPRFPDPAKESQDSFPITEYLFSGMRVVLSPLDDLLSPADIERLRADQKAVEQQRLEAIRKKNAEAGRAGTPALPKLPGGVPLKGDGELGRDDDTDGEDG